MAIAQVITLVAVMQFTFHGPNVGGPGDMNLRAEHNFFGGSAMERCLAAKREFIAEYTGLPHTQVFANCRPFVRPSDSDGE